MYRNIMHGRENVVHVIEDFMNQSARQDTRELELLFLPVSCLA